jgi:uncharacterized membrane protein
MENTSSTRAMNVDSGERVISILAGSFLLLDSIINKNLRLGKAAAGGFLLYRGISGHCPGYALAGRESFIPSRNVNIRVNMTVDVPRVQVYAAWRKLENLPKFMSHLVSVTETSENIYLWKAAIPNKAVPVTWRATIVRDVPGEMISWRPMPDSIVSNSGKVEFRDAEDGNGTEILVNISYEPPMGLIGKAVSEFFHPALERLVRKDVLNFKDFIEANVERMELNL